MGGSQSTRSVAVDREDPRGKIYIAETGTQITESALKRLRGENEYEGEGPKEPTEKEESSKEFEMWARLMQNMKEDQIRETNVFKETVKAVEEKFLKQTCMPVCQDLQQDVFHCYQNNGDQPLNCSSKVTAFYTCVEKARQNALASKV